MIISSSIDENLYLIDSIEVIVKAIKVDVVIHPRDGFGVSSQMIIYTIVTLINLI